MIRAEQAVLRLQGEGAWLCIVESCTGGLLSHGMTDVPGASRVLWAAITAYDNSAKTSLVGVPPDTIERHGAVSEETALAMARGGLARMRKDHPAAAVGGVPLYCFATTGIAGPGGATPSKPVGLGFAAVASLHAGSQAIRIANVPGLPRAENKRLFAEAAFGLLLAHPSPTALA